MFFSTVLKFLFYLGHSFSIVKCGQIEKPFWRFSSKQVRTPAGNGSLVVGLFMVFVGEDCLSWDCGQRIKSAGAHSLPVVKCIALLSSGKGETLANQR